MRKNGGARGCHVSRERGVRGAGARRTTHLAEEGTLVGLLVSSGADAYPARADHLVGKGEAVALDGHDVAGRADLPPGLEFRPLCVAPAAADPADAAQPPVLVVEADLDAADHPRDGAGTRFVAQDDAVEVALTVAEAPPVRAAPPLVGGIEEAHHHAFALALTDLGEQLALGFGLDGHRHDLNGGAVCVEGGMEGRQPLGENGEAVPLRVVGGGGQAGVGEQVEGDEELHRRLSADVELRLAVGVHGKNLAIQADLGQQVAHRLSDVGGAIHELTAPAGHADGAVSEPVQLGTVAFELLGHAPRGAVNERIQRLGVGDGLAEHHHPTKRGRWRGGGGGGSEWEWERRRRRNVGVHGRGGLPIVTERPCVQLRGQEVEAAAHDPAERMLGQGGPLGEGAHLLAIDERTSIAAVAACLGLGHKGADGAGQHRGRLWAFGDEAGGGPRGRTGAAHRLSAKAGGRRGHGDLVARAAGGDATKKGVEGCFHWVE